VAHRQQNYDDADQDFAGRFQAFMDLAQPAMTIEPGEGALDRWN